MAKVKSYSDGKVVTVTLEELLQTKIPKLPKYTVQQIIKQIVLDKLGIPWNQYNIAISFLADDSFILILSDKEIKTDEDYLQLLQRASRTEGPRSTLREVRRGSPQTPERVV